MIKKTIIDIKNDPLRLLRFGIIGIGSVLIYSFAFPTYFELFKTSTLNASMLAYGTAMIFSFLGHKKYTFRSKSDYARQIRRFLITSAFGFSLTVLIMEVVVHSLGFHYLVGVLVVDVAVAAFSFIIMQIYVFADRQTDQTIE